MIDIWQGSQYTSEVPLKIDTIRPYEWSLNKDFIDFQLWTSLNRALTRSH